MFDKITLLSQTASKHIFLAKCTSLLQNVKTFSKNLNLFQERRKTTVQTMYIFAKIQLANLYKYSTFAGLN